jgi:preprotein translocase subunit SecA
MTGTALTEAAEFAEIYQLGVVEIPTNVPVARIDHDDKIFKSLREKEESIVTQVRACIERGQPVLVGTTSIEKSERLAALLEREKIPHEVLNARHHEREAYIVAQAGRPGGVTIATNMAGRGTDIKLGGNFEMRADAEIDKTLPEAEQERLRQALRAEIARDHDLVIESGGLFIIGTERHESRRIDNQLRGRAGRQGDPGASIFFLSLEDDLMRIFGSDKMEMLLGNKTIGLREGEALTHPWISKALERAQARVEAQNFEIRKNLLKFDNVMNDQRKVIYEQRCDIMGLSDVAELVKDMRHSVVNDMVARCIPAHSYAEQWNIESLKTDTLRLLNLDLPVDEWAREEGIADAEILERLMDASDRKFAEKSANAGLDVYKRLEKAMVLQQLDQHWKEHLLNLDHLRQGINLRAFGQRDPLNEYKTEAFQLFQVMLDQLRESVTQTMSLVEFNISPAAEESILGRQQQQSMHETRQDPALAGASVHRLEEREEPQSPLPGRTVRNREFDAKDPETWAAFVPRNAACPCGSGKKFKYCHGKLS